MRLRVLMMAGLATGAAPAQERQANPLVEALAACLPIRADAARLACMDAAAGRLVAAARADDVVVVTKEEVKTSRRSLFGLSINEDDAFPGRAATVERIDRLDTTIANAVPLGRGRWTLVLTEGGRWQTTEDWEYGDPRAGMAVEIRRGALGSYRLSAKGQRVVRVQRIN